MNCGNTNLVSFVNVMMQFVYLENEEKIIKKETTISIALHIHKFASMRNRGIYLNMLILFFMPNAFL